MSTILGLVGKTMSDAPQYTEPEQAQLSWQLSTLNNTIQLRKMDHRSASMELLREMHRAIFQGVCGHAGQCRGPGQLSEYLCFGPHRSVHRNEVAARLREALIRAENQVVAAMQVDGTVDRVFAVMDAGIETHARIIQIHPFEDGNGRTSRAFCDYMFVRGALPPVPMEHTKTTYINRLNAYFKDGMRDIRPLRDLYLSSAPQPNAPETAARDS